MKALTLLFAIAVLALSACQASSPVGPSQDGDRNLETACSPEGMPC